MSVHMADKMSPACREGIIAAVVQRR